MEAEARRIEQIKRDNKKDLGAIFLAEIRFSSEMWVLTAHAHVGIYSGDARSESKVKSIYNQILSEYVVFLISLCL